MRTFTTAAVFAVLAGLSSTQITAIDPDSVPKATRESWCLSQKTSCPLLCLQYPGNSAATESNDCDSDTLNWSCVCSNGLSPNVSEYSQTIPYYECTTYNDQCVAACGHDNTCSDKCRTSNPCGAQNPTRVNTSTITTMSATATGTGASATGDAIITGFGGTPTATGSSSNGKSGAGSVTLQLGQTYGLAVVVAGLFGGFALVL